MFDTIIQNVPSMDLCLSDLEINVHIMTYILIESLETQNTSSFIDTIYNSIANSSDFASETIYDNFPIPDTILADPDLHDHDLIDNVMYVYFGPSQPDQPDAGRQIVIVGAVGGLVAQLLVLSGIICKLKSHQSCFVLINLEVALVASNLLYMLGVQSTRSTDSCSAVALSLHYLHIVTGVWLLFYTYFSSKQRPPIHYTLFTWLSPLPFTLTLYLWDKSMYETRHFCFLNIQRGLFFTFFCPVTILLIVNTVLCVVTSLKISSLGLPFLFSFDWLFSILSLDTSKSLLFSVIYVGLNILLNWSLLICWLPACQSDGCHDNEDDELEDDELFWEEYDDTAPVCVKIEPQVPTQPPISIISSGI
ncbi:hypothetical protein M8J76_001817 [Diaphorina citri]|nr:hypothetical protein M8J76_001817 [Diaphorina citri]